MTSLFEELQRPALPKTTHSSPLEASQSQTQRTCLRTNHREPQVSQHPPPTSFSSPSREASLSSLSSSLSSHSTEPPLSPSSRPLHPAETRPTADAHQPQRSQTEATPAVPAWRIVYYSLTDTSQEGGPVSIRMASRELVNETWADLDCFYEKINGINHEVHKTKLNPGLSFPSAFFNEDRLILPSSTTLELFYSDHSCHSHSLCIAGYQERLPDADGYFTHMADISLPPEVQNESIRRICSAGCSPSFAVVTESSKKLFLVHTETTAPIITLATFFGLSSSQPVLSVSYTKNHMACVTTDGRLWIAQLQTSNPPDKTLHPIHFGKDLRASRVAVGPYHIVVAVDDGRLLQHCTDAIQPLALSVTAPTAPDAAFEPPRFQDVIVTLSGEPELPLWDCEELAAGNDFTVALMRASTGTTTLITFGSRNDVGQLGRNTSHLSLSKSESKEVGDSPPVLNPFHAEEVIWSFSAQSSNTQKTGSSIIPLTSVVALHALPQGVVAECTLASSDETALCSTCVVWGKVPGTQDDAYEEPWKPKEWPWMMQLRDALNNTEEQPTAQTATHQPSAHVPLQPADIISLAVSETRIAFFIAQRISFSHHQLRTVGQPNTATPSISTPPSIVVPRLKLHSPSHGREEMELPKAPSPLVPGSRNANNPKAEASQAVPKAVKEFWEKWGPGSDHARRRSVVEDKLLQTLLEDGGNNIEEPLQIRRASKSYEFEGSKPVSKTHISNFQTLESKHAPIVHRTEPFKNGGGIHLGHQSQPDSINSFQMLLDSGRTRQGSAHFLDAQNATPVTSCSVSGSAGDNVSHTRRGIRHAFVGECANVHTSTLNAPQPDPVLPKQKETSTFNVGSLWRSVAAKGQAFFLPGQTKESTESSSNHESRKAPGHPNIIRSQTSALKRAHPSSSGSHIWESSESLVLPRLAGSEWTDKAHQHWAKIMVEFESFRQKTTSCWEFLLLQQTCGGTHMRLVEPDLMASSKHISRPTSVLALRQLYLTFRETFVQGVQRTLASEGRYVAVFQTTFDASLSASFTGRPFAEVWTPTKEWLVLQRLVSRAWEKKIPRSNFCNTYCLKPDYYARETLSLNPGESLSSLVTREQQFSFTTEEPTSASEEARLRRLRREVYKDLCRILDPWNMYTLLPDDADVPCFSWEIKNLDLLIFQKASADVSLLPSTSAGAKTYLGMYKGTRVTIKTTPTQGTKDAVLKRHLREIFVHSTLNHPNVVAFMGASIRGPRLILVVEQCLRGSLFSLLHESSFELSLRDSVRLAADVALALNYLHRFGPSPIVHRDVKSANVFLTGGSADGHGITAKVGLTTTLLCAIHCHQMFAPLLPSLLHFLQLGDFETATVLPQGVECNSQHSPLARKYLLHGLGVVRAPPSPLGAGRLFLSSTISAQGSKLGTLHAGRTIGGESECEGEAPLTTGHLLLEEAAAASQTPVSVISTFEGMDAGFPYQGSFASANVGTFQWMAPEVVSKHALFGATSEPPHHSSPHLVPAPKQPSKSSTIRSPRLVCYTEKCDIFSFGALLWEICCRTPPFLGLDGRTAALLAANRQVRLPTDCLAPCPAAIVSACFHADPSQRPDMATILEGLEIWEGTLQAENTQKMVTVAREMIADAFGSIQRDARHLLESTKTPHPF